MTDSADFSLKDGRYQIWAALVANSITILSGVNLAFATILLPQILKVEDSLAVQSRNDSVIGSNETAHDILQITKDEASWVASVVAISTPVGSLLSGLLMDRFGRKMCTLITQVLFIIAWLITAGTTSHIALLYVGRFLGGCAGGLSTSATVYISEISHSSLRPRLLATVSVFVSLGILVTTLLGRLFPWRANAVAYAGLAGILLMVLMTLPESPLWLAKHGAEQSKLKKSLRYFYRKDVHYDEALERLREGKKEPLISVPVEPSEVERMPILNKRTWKPFLLLIAVFSFQQFSGCYVIIIYAMQIFESSGSIAIDSWTSLLILSLIRFAMSIGATYFAIGRKKLLLASGFGMALSILMAGIYLHINPPSMFPVICTLGFVTFSAFGYLVVPWGLTSELLPYEVRGWGSGAMVSYAYLCMFVCTKSYFFMEEAMGIANIFLLYGVVSAASVVFVYFYIPETLGRTFEEIERKLAR